MRLRQMMVEHDVVSLCAIGGESLHDWVPADAETKSNQRPPCSPVPPSGERELNAEPPARSANAFPETRQKSKLNWNTPNKKTYCCVYVRAKKAPHPTHPSLDIY